jgi:hypothetical protein
MRLVDLVVHGVGPHDLFRQIFLAESSSQRRCVTSQFRATWKGFYSTAADASEKPPYVKKRVSGGISGPAS